MPKFKIDRSKIPELATGNFEYAQFIRKFNQCARLLENSRGLSQPESDAINRLMTALQNEMHSYNPQNPIPEGGMESLNLIRSLTSEIRDPNQIAKAVSDVSPYIARRETTASLPHKEPQNEEQSSLEKGFVGALKGVVGLAVIALGVGLVGACVLSGGFWMDFPSEVLKVGAEISADGANDIAQAINGNEPTAPMKSENLEHQKDMRSALEGLKGIAAKEASHKSLSEPDEPELERYQI